MKPKGSTLKCQSISEFPLNERFWNIDVNLLRIYWKSLVFSFWQCPYWIYIRQTKVKICLQMTRNIVIHLSFISELANVTSSFNFIPLQLGWVSYEFVFYFTSQSYCWIKSIFHKIYGTRGTREEPQEITITPRRWGEICWNFSAYRI